MSRVVLVVCLQACIFQLAYSQSIGASYPAFNSQPPGSYHLDAATPPLLEARLPSLPGSYGGAGVGDISVVGQMPVLGTTVVAGQVPILGAVKFRGEIPASGIVSLSAGCSCGFNFT